MPTLYVKDLPADADAYLRGVADAAGVSIAAVVRAVLREASARGWTIERGQDAVVKEKTP